MGDTESVEIFRPPLTPRRKRDSVPKSNFLSVGRQKQFPISFTDSYQTGYKHGYGHKAKLKFGNYGI